MTTLTDTISATGTVLYPAPEDWNTHYDTVRVEWEAKVVVNEGYQQFPYFSLTGSVYDGPRAADSRYRSGGAIGDNLVQLLPGLAPINRLHLSNINGEPLHAEANGLYFLGNLREAEERHLPRVARHFRIERADAFDLWVEFCVADDQPQFVADYCDTQRDRWKAEAQAGLALIELLATLG